MKIIKPIVVLLLLSFSFMRCQEKEAVITYEVTPEFSKKIDKPEVHFTVDIPENLEFKKPEEGKKTYSYGMIREINEEKVVTEMYSLSYINLDGMSLEKDGLSFMKQILGMLKSGGYEIEEETIGVLEFDDDSYLSLQLIGQMKEGVNPEYVGRYYFNVVAKPNPYTNTHIIMLMSARDDQGIASYEDFKDKLAVSTLWKTFKYLK